ncbi:unnamed protein product [Nippostrongylus brasiliensis]|uniref:Uncharacterized protein n=1 Tax=Nippostrongylus brasiliensis TaxID=27835 RepID=A0A0N4XVD1_NIPBR|nr:hypothetical protein Q1695_009231 [Nippostrongylus brasiliensis]VDL70332.1 unnamed protein product [Nippostrongylus brasiliensis]
MSSSQPSAQHKRSTAHCYQSSAEVSVSATLFQRPQHRPVPEWRNGTHREDNAYLLIDSGSESKQRRVVDEDEMISTTTTTTREGTPRAESPPPLATPIEHPVEEHLPHMKIKTERRRVCK